MSVNKYPNPEIMDDQEVAHALVGNKEQVDYIIDHTGCADGFAECGGDIVQGLYDADDEIRLEARQIADRILQCIHTY